MGKIGHKLVHFSDLFGPGIFFCKPGDDFAAGCKKLFSVANDKEVKNNLKKMADYIVDMDEPCYGKRILDLVEEVEFLKK